jgi:hypothetical protein
VPSFSGLLAGLVSFLSDDDDLTDLLGDTSGTPWVFSRNLGVRVEGTEKAAVVVSYAGQALSSNLHNTAAFVKVMVSIWVDPARDVDGNCEDPTGAATQERVFGIYDVIDPLLHRLGGQVKWGDVTTISSRRLALLGSVYDVPDGDGLLKADASYTVGI